MNQSSDTEASQADAASQAYVGQWRGLVSTTNWEKGRIIHEWREALRTAGAEASEFSDESWSRRVGQVSPQHVGRLRRVYDRFGAARSGFPGLFWSHFQAAIDWGDAEMWLEGAVQNDWSISQMRSSRSQIIHGDDGNEPVESEMDEDFLAPDGDLQEVLEVASPVGNGSPSGNAQRRSSNDAAAGESSEGAALATFDPDPADAPAGDAAGFEPRDAASAGVRPFEHLAELPEDLAEAFENYKLAILHHKLDGWRQVASADVLASLDALKKLALAPSGT